MLNFAQHEIFNSIFLCCSKKYFTFQNKFKITLEKSIEKKATNTSSNRNKIGFTWEDESFNKIKSELMNALAKTTALSMLAKCNELLVTRIKSRCIFILKSMQSMNM